MENRTDSLPGLFNSIESSNAFIVDGDLFFIEEVIAETSSIKIMNTKQELTTASVGFIEQMGSDVQFLSIEKNMTCPRAIQSDLELTPDELLDILNDANRFKKKIPKGDYLESMADHDFDLAPFISDEWMCDWLEHHLFSIQPASREVSLVDLEVGFCFLCERAVIYSSHDARSKALNTMPKINMPHDQLDIYTDSIIKALSMTNSKERISDIKMFYKTIEGNWISPKLAVIKNS